MGEIIRKEFEELGWVSGRYYSSNVIGGATGVATAIVDDTDFFLPIYVPQPCVLTKIGIDVATAHTGGATNTVIFGIYNNKSNGDVPLGVPNGAPLVTSAEVSLAATGDTEATIALGVARGWYWLGMNIEDDDTTLLRIRSLAHTVTLYNYMGKLSAAATGSSPCIRIARAYDGTMPTLSGLGFADFVADISLPYIYVKI